MLVLGTSIVFLALTTSALSNGTPTGRTQYRGSDPKKRDPEKRLETLQEEAQPEASGTGFEQPQVGSHLLGLCCHFGPVRLFVTLWTVAHQIPLSRGFSSQEYWSGLPFPPPGHLPDPGIEPVSFGSLALAGGFFYH